MGLQRRQEMALRGIVRGDRLGRFGGEEDFQVRGAAGAEVLGQDEIAAVIAGLDLPGAADVIFLVLEPAHDG